MAKLKHHEEFPEKGETKIDPNATKNVLGALMTGYADDHYNFIETESKIISSGSLLLDSLIKVRTGSVVRLVGKGAELGKSRQAFLFADNYMKSMPKSKGFLVKAESRLSEEQKKLSGLKFVYKAEDWCYGSVFVLECNIFETVATILEKILKLMYVQGENLVGIIDSLDGLILKDDLISKSYGDNMKVAGCPLLTKYFFKRLGFPINKYNALFLITGQYSANIKLDVYSPDVPRQAESSGGNSIAHQADYVLQYLPRYNGDLIWDTDEKPDPYKNKIIGIWSTIEIKKSATDVTGTKVKIPIKKNCIGNAIWKEKEIGDLIISWELAKRESAKGSFEFSSEILEQAKSQGIEIEPKIRSLNKIYDYLGDNSKVLEFFEDWFKKKLS